MRSSLRTLSIAASLVPLSLLSQAPHQPLHPDTQAQLLHPVSPMPSFSVVSVRPSAPAEEDFHTRIGADSYDAERVRLNEVLAYAFGLSFDQELAKAPPWVRQDRFDIHGKLDEQQVAALHAMSRDDREEQMRLMAQSMLKERFHLLYHFETRELPVYRLQIAKSGFKCPSDPNAPPAISDTSRPRFRWSAAPAPPPPPPGWHPPSPAEQKTLQQSMHMRTKGWPFWLVVTMLSHQPELAGKPVIDDTGLNGLYDCELTWSREGSGGTGQFFFSAIQDQLGLKLQPSRGKVEVLVVDSVDRPSEN